MSERYWPGPALAATTLFLLATAITGCGNTARTGPASATKVAGVAGVAADTGRDSNAYPGPNAYAGSSTYTARQLEEALLPEVGGARPAAAIEAGDYGLLPEVQTSKQTMRGIKVTPAKCAGVVAMGFSSAPFSSAPAAAVTFQVGRDWISEVLVAATSQLAVKALSDTLPAGCAHYQATVDGKTFSYSVRQAAVSGIAAQARALNIQATGYAEVNVWSVVFRGSGFVGTVTMVGPDLSEPGVRRVAQEADAYARRSLPQV